MQELSDAADVMAEGSLLGPLDRQRRLRWAERLQVTQPSLPTQVTPSSWTVLTPQAQHFNLKSQPFEMSVLHLVTFHSSANCIYTC